MEKLKSSSTYEDPVFTLKDGNFSVRDMKLLKRILKREYKCKDINYDKVLFDFPGKSRAQLIEVCSQIRARRSRSRNAPGHDINEIV